MKFFDDFTAKDVVAIIVAVCICMTLMIASDLVHDALKLYTMRNMRVKIPGVIDPDDDTNRN